ncbi:MAG: nucleoside kinase [Anaerolineales bacterium]|nr:nucleoside kinase [Anaerolineales bacterium]
MKDQVKFKEVTPRPEVEVHLSDGRVLSGPRGASLGDFLKAVDGSFTAPFVAAVVNGNLRELTYPIHLDAEVRPVLMSEADGSRIYRRSLTFLLEMAFSDLFPRGTLTIDHSISSGGYFCQVSGREPLSTGELEVLNRRMEELVAADLPFERQQTPLEEAVAYFKEKGFDDKVCLLAHRTKDYLTLYRLGENMDYHHGYMVPSTGYLRWFGLVGTDGGFTLRFPRRHRPTELLPLPEYPKLLQTFRVYGNWLTRLGIDNVGSLNDAICEGREHEVILVSEALHEQYIAGLAAQIAEKRDQVRLVLISGPSSSGKTTFSRRLTVQLLALGISPFPLELDNFFVDREKTPVDENGEFDFEALEAIDLPLLAACLEQLVAGNPVRLPHYNFKTGLREEGDVIQLQPGQMLILEGIHGLNPRLIPEALTGKAFRVYISALTQLNLDRHNRVSTTDTRLIRRIVRDARERGYSAAETISRWESVRRGEKRHIFPFQENADVMFNSALAYELSALKLMVEPLLRQVPHGTPEYIEAKRILAFLAWFKPINPELVPENSIAKEFLGGSILKNFRLWKEQDR